MWLLESVWSPAGVLVYLTFLVDPMNDDQNRKKGETVWAVGLSDSKPESRLSKFYALMNLNQGWQKELPEFLKQLSLLRDQSKEV